MNDNLDPINSEENIPSQPSDFDSAMSQMENLLESVPSNEYITITSNGGNPVYAVLEPGEDGLTIQAASQRAGLTLGAVNAYVDGNVTPLTTFVPAGSKVTLVGNVKGG